MRRRELRRQRRPQGQAREDDPRHGDPRRHPLERRHAGKDEQRGAQVGGDHLAVGEHVGAGHGEQQAERGGGEAPRRPRPQEHDRGQGGGEEQDHRPPAEQQPVAVVPTVEEASADLVGPPHRPRRVVGGEAHVHRHQRGGGEPRDERRVVGVEAELAEAEGAVSGREVHDLVVHRGLGAQAREAEAEQQREPGGEHDGIADATPRRGRVGHGRTLSNKGRVLNSRACGLRRLGIEWRVALIVSVLAVAAVLLDVTPAAARARAVSAGVALGPARGPDQRALAGRSRDRRWLFWPWPASRPRAAAAARRSWWPPRSRWAGCSSSPSSDWRRRAPRGR